MPAPSLLRSEPVLLFAGVVDPLFTTRLRGCVIRQSSATAASCEVLLVDGSAGADAPLPDGVVDAAGAPVAAPLLSGPRELLERSRELGLVLGEGVTFEGLVRSVEVRWSSDGGSLLSLKAHGRLAAADTPPPTLTFQENLQEFTWSAGLEPRLSVRARGLASGIPPLRCGASAEIEGLREAWSGSYRIGRVEWNWDLERGGFTSFEARRLTGPRARRPAPTA